MTAITTKSGRKRLDICVMHTPKWAKTRENPERNACSHPRNAVSADNKVVALEITGEIRQSHPNDKLLGKYQIKEIVMTIRPILLGSSLYVLSACGGSGIGANADAVIVSPHVNFAELEGRYYTIGAEAGTLPLSTSATMPSTGRASMNGVVLLIDPASSANSAAGQIDISVDFASNEVDGIASDFRLVSEGGMVVGGTLVLDADITHGVTSGFAGTLAGELIQEDAVNVSIDVEGDFYGDDAQILAGEGTGTYVGDGISGNLNAQILAH